MAASRWFAKRRSQCAALLLNLPDTFWSPPLCALPRTEEGQGGGQADIAQP